MKRFFSILLVILFLVPVTDNSLLNIHAEINTDNTVVYEYILEMTSASRFCAIHYSVDYDVNLFEPVAVNYPWILKDEEGKYLGNTVVHDFTDDSEPLYGKCIVTDSYSKDSISMTKGKKLIVLTLTGPAGLTANAIPIMRFIRVADTAIVKDIHNYGQSIPFSWNYSFKDVTNDTVITSGEGSFEGGILNAEYYEDGLSIPYNNTTVGISASLYHNSKKINGISVNFNSIWFSKDSIDYNHNIATLCSQILLEGYQQKSDKNNLNLDKWDLELTLKELGFNTQSGYYVFMKGTGRDEEDYFIFSKPISKNGKKYNLVCVGCVGSNEKQWNSDFDPWGLESKTTYKDTDTTYTNNHYGFNDAKNYVYNNLTDYLDTHGYTKDNTVILLTGHSRGAAAANLIGAKLIDDGEHKRVLPENLFTYTFATPNCTKNVNRKTGKSDSKYNRIHNIVYPTDFVTKAMPHTWGYGKYGITYSLPTLSNDKYYSSHYKKAMKKYYNIINSAISGNEVFHDYPLGEGEVYLAIKALTTFVKSPNNYYHTRYHVSGLMFLSPYEYFQNGLCPFVNNSSNIEKVRAVTIMIPPLMEPASVLYKSLSLYFISEEVLARINVDSSISFLDSGRFADAHKMETYCSFMLGLNSKEVTDGKNRKGLKGSVNCPVDVEVIDKDTGEIVGRIVNNTVDEEIAAKENSIVMTVDDDEKQFWLPSNGNYDVRLIGNDAGVMDYSLSEMDSNIGEVSRTNYNDVPVEKDKVYTGIVNDTSQVENGDEPEPALFVLNNDNGDEILADETFSSEETIEFTIETNVVGSGTATENLSVTSGDYVTLIASPYHSDFLGWYQGDVLVTTDTTYRFRPTENEMLTAKFTEAIFLLGDIDLDDTVTIIDATYIQRNLASIEIPFEFNETLADTDEDGTVTILDATYIQRWLASIPSNDHIGNPIKT